MARQEIVNGETGLQVRADLNANFTELYTFAGNLSGLTDVPAARSALALGTAAVQDVGAFATAAQGALAATALQPAAIGVSVQAFDPNTAKTDVPQEYTRQQNFGMQTLVDGATISWDLNVAQVAEVTLEGNRTLANPTNQRAGATYLLIIRQDATGSRTLNFDTAYKFASADGVPTLSTAANAVDVISFISDGTNLYGAAQFNFV